MSSLQQEVYESIRTQLLKGRWQPGHRLREQKLATELGVNRNPVREALLKLAGEGFLEREAGIGCRVANVDTKALADVWELREAIEGMAARLAAPIITETQLLRMEHEHQLMQRLIAIGQETELAEADNHFHQMLLRASGNQSLLEVWNRYLVRIVSAQAALIPRYPDLADRLRTTFTGHQRILEALHSRDPQNAEQTVRDHIAAGREGLLELLT